MLEPEAAYHVVTKSTRVAPVTVTAIGADGLPDMITNSVTVAAMSSPVVVSRVVVASPTLPFPSPSPIASPVSIVEPVTLVHSSSLMGRSAESVDIGRSVWSTGLWIVLLVRICLQPV
jgi:hypothetical protein